MDRKLTETEYNELMKIRTRARESKSLTGHQANLLLIERDEIFKGYLGSQNALAELRAFMAKDAPAWALERVRKATNTHAGTLEEYRLFVEEQNG